MENIREFRSGQSVTDHCKCCKGLLYKHEEDNSLCEDCFINQIHDIANRSIRKFLYRPKVKDHS